MTFSHDRKFFDTIDYIIFAMTLIVPILIGVYYSFISGKKPKTMSEYLVGNRKMNLFPVSMSLSASVISGFYLIGPISEVYFYGVQFILQVISVTLATSFFATLYLPTLYNLKITSTFEYLQMRFDYKVRLLGSFIFLVKTIIVMALWIYAPILLLDQVTGIGVNVLIPICSGICIFYTFGGVRGVIWADTFQMTVMLLGMIAITIVGAYNVGELSKIWEINQQGQRLQLFDFNPDPRLRQSFWILLLGNNIDTMAYLTTSQFVIQRCLSVPTLLKSKQAILIQLILSATTIILSCSLGLILYAAFHDCDPTTAKMISYPDQLLPYFIMNLKNGIPGLPSVLISISFCAALSSVSSALNSVSGVIMIDFIHPLLKRPMTDAQGSSYMKIISVMAGVLFMGMTFTLNSSNNLIQTSVSLIAISLGTSFGVFTLGLLLPWANATGALIGGIMGGVMVAWMSIGSLISSAAERTIYSTLPLSVENCQNFTAINETLIIGSKPDMDEPFFLYSVSFHYYSMIGAFTAIVVGMVVSYFTGFNNPTDMDRKLFSPAIYRYLRRDKAFSKTTDTISLNNT